MRVTILPLQVRSDYADSSPESPSTSDSQPREPLGTPDKQWLKPLDGPPVYVSLLASDPYEIPSCLLRLGGLPPNPKLSLPTNGSPFMLTPDILRYIGATAGHFSKQIHEVHLAFRAANARVSLQQQEKLRLCGKCQELKELISKLTGTRHPAVEARLQKVQDEQKRLLQRSDRIVQTLMEKAFPELSEHETKWFEELKRMKEEIVGSGKYDEGSLAARTRLLEAEYERLMPGLKTMLEKERQQQKMRAPKNSLGSAQAFELGERANFERTRLNSMEESVVKLAGKLDINLGQPPSATLST